MAAEQPADHRDRIAWPVSRFRAARPAPRRPGRTAAGRRRPGRAPAPDRCPAPSSGRDSRSSRCVGVTSSASRSPSRCTSIIAVRRPTFCTQRSDVVERRHRRAVDRGDAVAFGQHAPGRRPRLDPCPRPAAAAGGAASGRLSRQRVAARRFRPAVATGAGCAPRRRRWRCARAPRRRCGRSPRSPAPMPLRSRSASARSPTASSVSPRLELRLRGEAFDVADDRREIRAADDEHRPQQRDAQQQVGERARRRRWRCAGRPTCG